MNIWIFFSRNEMSSEGDLFSVNILKKSIKKSGHFVTIVDRSTLTGFSSGRGGIETLKKGSDPSLNHPDYIIPWDGTTTSDDIFRVISAYEKHGIPSLNPTEAVNLARDKQLMMAALSGAGINIPRTFCVGITPGNLLELANTVTFPLLIKPNSGTNALGITLVESKQTFLDICHLILSFGHENDNSLIFQEFLKTTHSSITRILSVEGKILIAYEKSDQSMFKISASLGATCRKIEISPELTALSSAIHEATGLKVFGADLLPTKKGYSICDVNSSPSLRIPVHFSGETLVDTFTGMILASHANER